MENELFGKSWFLADLSLCESYLKLEDRNPICDVAVETMILQSSAITKGKHLQEVANHLDVLDRVPIMSMQKLAQRVKEDAKTVWVTCGTQYGLPLRSDVARAALKHGAIVGVAGASAHNAGYAGLVLHEWTNGELGRKIIKFYGGVKR